MVNKTGKADRAMEPQPGSDRLFYGSAEMLAICRELDEKARTCAKQTAFFEANSLTGRRHDMLGDLIAALERPEVISDILATFDPELLPKVAERAAQAQMNVGDFSAGAVRAFLDDGDDDLWFQLLTLIRKSEDPGLTAVRTILRWVVTA